MAIKSTTNNIIKTINALDDGMHFHLRLCLEGILIGVLTGLIVSLYRLSLEGCSDMREELYTHFSWEHWYLLAIYIAAMFLVSYLLYVVVKREPLCTGSGIPQIKGILLGKLHMNWLSILFYKFIGGVLAIGSGLSLGREGPSVQLGAAIAQGISRSRSRSRMEERFLMISGASAGLAAAFNAPLAGIIFGFEELYRNFSPLVLMGAATASVMSVAVTQGFFGDHPIFAVPVLKVLPIYMYPILIALGAFIGILGLFFNKVLFGVMDWYAKQTILKKMWKPALPIFTAVILGFVLPQALGGHGERLVDMLVKVQYGLGFLAVLYVVKFLFTIFAFGSGAPGGIFLPMLVMGAVAGSIFNHVLAMLGLTDPTYAANFVIFAMAAYFAAVVKAPITGATLIMEMTGSFEHLLALICVSMTAYMVMDTLKGEPVYDVLMNRRLRNVTKSEVEDSSKRIMLEKVVGNGSIADTKMIKSLQWPKNCLVVNIKRGTNVFVPNGETRLQAGDYLYILTMDSQIEELQKMFSERNYR